jgi:hypothetical protein
VPQCGSNGDTHSSTHLFMMMAVTQLMADHATDNTANNGTANSIATMITVSPNPDLLVPADFALNPNPLTPDNGIDVYHLGVIIATMVAGLAPVITVPGTGLSHGCQ